VLLDASNGGVGFAPAHETDSFVPYLGPVTPAITAAATTVFAQMSVGQFNTYVDSNGDQLPIPAPPPPVSFPAGTPTISVVRFVATIQETVESFDTIKQEAYKEGLASALTGVVKDDITLLVASSSISVTAEIVTGDPSIASSAEATLGSLSSAQLGSMTGVSVLSVSPPTTRVTMGQNVGATADADDEGLPGWGVAVFAILALLLIGFGVILCLMITREKAGKPVFQVSIPAPKSAVPVYTTSTSSAEAVSADKV